MPWIRKHASSVGLAGLLATLVVASTALAGGGTDANNADKVDGKHAVGAGASVNARKGKLVATSATTGRLPNNIITKAPDAQKLDGKDSTEFADVNHNHDTAYAAATHNHDADYAASSHTHDASAIIAGTLADARIPSGVTRDNEVMQIVTTNDGAGSGVDADLLDGQNSSAFANSIHTQDAGSIVSGALADARIPAGVARDSEVFSIVAAADGPGSGLNADQLDGLNSADVVQRAGTGEIAIHANIFDWETPTTTITRDPNASNLRVSSSANSSGIPFLMIPTIPGELYGKNLRFEGLVQCYDATDPGTTLSSVTITRITNTTGSPGSFSVHHDATDRDDEACRTYTPQSGSVTMTPTDQLSIQLAVAWTTQNALFEFGRTTLLFTPLP